MIKNLLQNFRTTLAGLILIGIGIEKLLSGNNGACSIELIVTGCGLLAAKDFDMLEFGKQKKTNEKQDVSD
jgi:hypothetical protein